MAKITRATQQLFGVGGNVGTGGYGAAAASNVNTQLASSTSLATIQGLAAWNTGWNTATLGASKFPAIEDLNAVDYTFSTQLAYILQQGAAIEYDAGTTYYIGSVVASPGTTALYKSLTNANLNNALSSSANWQFLGDLAQLGAANGDCYFQYNSATTCLLVPKNGNQVTFPSGSVAVIPSAGIALTYNAASINGTPSGTLSSNTLYYCYLWNNGSVNIIDVSQTAYATDANTGIVTKSGDATRVLVGMVYTNGSGQFLDGDGNRQVLSWFNRQQKRSRTNFTTNRSTSSTSYIELNSEIRNNVLNWAGQLVQFNILGSSSNNNTGASTDTATAIGFNGTSPEAEQSIGNVAVTANNPCPINIVGFKSGLTEGLNYGTVLGGVNGNTGTWYAANSISIGAAITLILLTLG